MESMTLEDIHLKINELSKKIFEPAGAELIELKVGGHKNDLLIQITADKPNGGITIGECVILNKALVAAIEHENIIPPESFSLELSSPGLDRPLVTRNDFMRCKAQELYFWLNTPVAGKSQVQGKLVEVTDTSLTISTADNKKIVLPLTAIIKGLLVI